MTETLFPVAFRHGTQYGYRVAGCRCSPCRSWYNASLRAYRQRRKARGERLIHGKWVKAQ
jgi:hypothetical protein